MAEYLLFHAFIAFSDGAVQVSNPASGLLGTLALTVLVSVLGTEVVAGVLVAAGVLVVVGVLVLVVLEELGVLDGLVVFGEPAVFEEPVGFEEVVVLLPQLVPVVLLPQPVTAPLMVVLDELTGQPDWLCPSRCMPRR